MWKFTIVVLFCLSNFFYFNLANPSQGLNNVKDLSQSEVPNKINQIHNNRPGTAIERRKKKSPIRQQVLCTVQKGKKKCNFYSRKVCNKAELKEHCGCLKEHDRYLNCDEGPCFYVIIC